jgi:hypothetical protein
MVLKKRFRTSYEMNSFAPPQESPDTATAGMAYLPVRLWKGLAVVDFGRVSSRCKPS